MIREFLGLALLAPALSACMSPRDLETPPVVVQTPQGPVTCQLYTKQRTSWDRAIDRPETMRVEQADTICRAEGKRRQG